VLTPDGRHVAAVVRDVALFDVESGKKVWKARPFPYPAKLALDAAGRKLAVKSNTGRIAILDAMSGKVQTDFANNEDGEGSNVCFSDCGEYLIDGSWNGVLKVRSAADGSVAAEHAFEAQRIDTVACLDGYVFVHHAHQFRGDSSPHASFTRWKWPLDQRTYDEFPFQPNQATGMNPLSKDSFLVGYGHPRSPDETAQPIVRVAVVDSRGAKDLCDTSDFGKIRGVRLFPNRKHVACAVEGHVLVVDLETGALHDALEVKSPFAISFSADGRLVAIGATGDSLVVPVQDILPDV
jgi:hypothetical protein